MKASVLFGAGWEDDSLEVLWRDADRAFCRLRRDDAEARHAFIPIHSGAEHPTLESVNRLTHEYELRGYLDGAWALRPVELVRERGQTMLVVDYAGGEPLDRLDPSADGDRTVSPTRRGAVRRTRSAPRTRAHPQGHQASQRARGLRNRAGLAHRIRHCVAPPARAPVARTSRVHRGNARLHGARADGTNEPLDRFPERPLLARRHVLRNADRQSSVHGLRSDGMGALSHRETTGRTQRAS